MTTNPSRITIIQGVFSFLIILMGVSAANCQQDLIFTKNFTELLNRHDLLYEMPVERWFRINPEERRFADYDLVVRSFEQDLEIRHIIRKHPSTDPPQVHGPLLLNHMATNKESADILVTRMNSTMLKEFGADWGMYADFTPKQQVTEYRYARLVSIYRLDGPIVHTLLLRDEPFLAFEEEEWCVIRFAEDRNQEN